jgi:hypothetical protein
MRENASAQANDNNNDNNNINDDDDFDVVDVNGFVDVAAAAARRASRAKKVARALLPQLWHALYLRRR